MENQENNWLDEVLGTSNTPKEIGADEQAVYTAGLTHPNDVELERILAEDWSEPAPQQPVQEAFDPYGYVPEQEAPAQEEPQEEVQADQQEQ